MNNPNNGNSIGFDKMINIRKRNLLARKEEMLSLFLVFLMGGSRRVWATSPNGLYGNFYSIVNSYTIVDASKHIDKDNYNDASKSFMFIKNIPLIERSAYISKPLDIVLVESSIENDVQDKCMLEFSYKEVNEKGKVKKKCITAEDDLQAPKKTALIVPYEGILSREDICDMQWVQNKYFRTSKSVSNAKMISNYAKSIYNQIIIKKYIECSKNKTDSFGDFLKEHDIVNNSLHIELNEPFVWKIVGRFKHFSVDEYRIKHLCKAFKDLQERYRKVLEENKTFREMADVGVYKFEEIYEENTERILNSIKKIRKKSKKKRGWKNLDEYIKNETTVTIELLCNGKFNSHMYVDINELETALENLQDLTKEREILIEIARSTKRDSNGLICVAELEKKLEKELKKLSKEEKERLNFAFVKGCENIWATLDEDGLQEEAFAFDREIVRLLIKRMNYISTNKKSIEEVLKINQDIISEIKERRDRIYNEYKLIVFFYSTYREDPENMLASSLVDYRNYVDALEIKDITQTRAIKKETKVERKEKIADKKKYIESILQNIEDMYCIYDEDLDKTVNKIEREKRKILNHDFKKNLFLFIDMDMKYMLTDIREFFSEYIDVIFSKKVNHFNKNGVAKAEDTLKKLKNIAESKSPEEIAQMVGFISKLKNNPKIKNIIVSYCYSSNKEKARNLYERVWRSLEIYSAIKIGYRWFLDCIRENQVDEVWVITKTFDLIDNYLAFMASYSEVWMNPVILVITSKYSSVSEERKRKAYIVYNSEDYSRSIYKEEIEITNENLNNFREARTMQDIEERFRYKDFGLYACRII